MNRRGLWLALAGLAACGDNHPGERPDAGAPIDAGGDAGGDAGPGRVATGRRLVDHAAVVGGLTSDGYVVYSELDASGHATAQVMPLAGGPATRIATSSGTGKSDLRFDVEGGVVFVWADRGNRVATLTVWSAATGVVPRGDNIRPGRAAATADGAMIAFERDITATTATLVGGPIAGPDRVIATASAEDGDCWRDTNLASGGDRLFVRYCPPGATAFSLRSVGAGGAIRELSAAAASASYSAARVIWREADGNLAASSDGATVDRLATGVAEVSLSHDQRSLAYRTDGGAIFTMPADHGAAATQVVAAPEATQLGPIAEDGQHVLYATQRETRGRDPVQPYTDVRVAGPSGKQTLVAGTTSCPGCLYDSFSPDGRYALVLDPIDNSQEADGAGPIEVFDLADGRAAAGFGAGVYTAFALGGDATGLDARFLFVDAVRDPALSTGWRYGLQARALGA
ncbi:MAG TPA: hypothetical protein VGC42_00110, partial [Kofleriaceae bacterium]